MNKISKFITNHSKQIVIIFFILLIPALIGYKKTKINYDILVYLPEDVETIKGEKILSDDFGIGAFSFVTVNGMTSREILNLEDEIKKINGVHAVLSVSDITDVSIPYEMIPDDIKSKVIKDDSTLVLVTFNGSTSEESTINAVKELRKIAKSPNDVSGMTSMVVDTMDLSEQEVVAYVIIAVALCLIVLIFATDSYLVPIFLLGNIGVAILYNLGSNIFLGEISYITKAITAVLQLGVTTDFSIFLYHKYEQAKEKNSDNKIAMQRAIEDTFKSVIGSSLTTIAGFLALCFMDLTLGKDIGIVMAKGVLCGLICVLTLFPALLLVFDKQITKTKHKNFTLKFEGLQKFAIQKHILIIIIFLVLLVPAIYGNNHTKVYYKLDKSLPDTLASSIANSNLKEKFNIVSPEIILIDKNLKTNELEKLTDELKDVKGVDLVLSSGEALSFGLPSDMLPTELTDMLENDNYQLIILNSTYEVASDELNAQIKHIDKIVKKYDKKSIVAGEGALMKDLTTIADHDFKMVNYSSILVIFIIMILVLKSASLPFVLIAAIEFAIFVNMSFAYYQGEVLPFIASIVVGTIQLGATIDYAILMSTKYLEERRVEKDKKIAMKRTLETSVPSIIISALCFFSATFGVAIYSKIDMIGAICKLLSRGAIISMLVVILLLPALLLMFDKIIMKTTKNMKEDLKMKKTKKIVSICIMGSLLLLPINTYALTKNESVYTSLDPSGKIKNTLVTNHLIINDEKEIEDESELHDIFNLNGKEKFIQDKNTLKWKAKGKDIFYQGKTEKELPIGIHIEYYLNGIKKDAKDIVGKKGDIQIEISFTNRLKNTVNINGKTEEVYTPFVVMSGMMLNNKENKKVEITNGKVVDTGNKSMMLSITSPGLYESLNINELNNMNKTTIKYTTTKFSLENIYIVATPKLIEKDDIAFFDEIGSLSSSIDKLQNSINTIENGAKKLENGSNSLVSGANEIQNSLNTVVSSISSLQNGTGNLKTGINSAIAGLDLAQTKINSLNLNATVTTLNTIKANNDNAITKLLESAGMDFQTLSAYVSNSSNAVNPDYTEKASILNAIISLKTSNGAFDQVMVNLNSLSEIIPKIAELKSGLMALNNGTVQIYNGLGSLKTGVQKIYAGQVQLTSGAKELSSGANELSMGISKFNQEGIHTLSNYSGKINVYSSKAEALVNLSKNYNGFTNHNSSSTLFINKVGFNK